MNVFLCTFLAVLSIWDYPARFPAHRQLSQQFVAAVREGDTETMEETCRKGVALLPDDPTWHYNLACSLAYFANRDEEAFDELERAIDLGFRDAEAVKKDADLKRLEKKPRYKELIEYVERMKMRPILTGPMATVEATGVFGKPVVLGEQNVTWDFDSGCFVAQMKLAPAFAGGNVGDLYMNRDNMHSVLRVASYPGLTPVRLDQTGRDRGAGVDIPNMLFPYPVFGNCSRAYTQDTTWRSLPRMLTTGQLDRLGAMVKLYLSNQIWVFPANADIAPIGTNGDVFASITPYWITTAGRSFSDLPYLEAALEASRALKPTTKAEIVRQNLLSPTIQTLIRKSLKGVTNEVAYLSAKAHPTAFPPGGVDKKRLSALAAALTPGTVPPLVSIELASDNAKPVGVMREVTYGSAFAWAFVLRSDAMVRTFRIRARGATDYAFVKTHGDGVDVKIEQEEANVAKIVLNRSGMSPTNRVDIAVFGRNGGTGWGAPCYVSFARMDPTAPYSDPLLTPLPQPTAKDPAAPAKGADAPVKEPVAPAAK